MNLEYHEQIPKLMGESFDEERHIYVVSKYLLTNFS